MSQTGKIKNLAMDSALRYSASVPSRSAAALAYRGIFSVAPLLLISVLLTSLFVGQETAEKEIAEIVDTVLDEDSAEVVGQSVKTMFWTTERELTLTSLIGFAVLLYGASALFRETKFAIHSVWGLPPSPKKGLLAYFIFQAVSILMVFIIGIFVLFLILISIFVHHLEMSALPVSFAILDWGSWIGGLLAMSLLIGLLFRFVPDVSLPWSDLWFGALSTALLMMVGVWGIRLYFTIGDVGSTAGTAGAIVVLLLGSYFAAHIFLFGASFAAAYAVNFGSQKALRELGKYDSSTKEMEDEGSAGKP